MENKGWRGDVGLGALLYVARRGVGLHVQRFVVVLAVDVIAEGAGAVEGAVAAAGDERPVRSRAAAAAVEDAAGVGCTGLGIAEWHSSSRLSGRLEPDVLGLKGAEERIVLGGKAIQDRPDRKTMTLSESNWTRQSGDCGARFVPEGGRHKPQKGRLFAPCISLAAT